MNINGLGPPITLPLVKKNAETAASNSSTSVAVGTRQPVATSEDSTAVIKDRMRVQFYENQHKNNSANTFTGDAIGAYENVANAEKREALTKMLGVDVYA